MKEHKNIHHGSLLWIITALLSCILLLLVFKAGMLAGGTRSHFSSWKTGHSQAGMAGYHTGQKKATFEAFKLKAEAEGMTMEEYKAHLIEKKEQ